jgi:hypothetical protein
MVISVLCTGDVTQSVTQVSEEGGQKFKSLRSICLCFKTPVASDGESIHEKPIMLNLNIKLCTLSGSLPSGI